MSGGQSIAGSGVDSHLAPLVLIPAAAARPQDLEIELFPRIRELLERADQVLRESAQATLAAEQGLSAAARHGPEPGLLELSQERDGLRAEVDALRREREVIRQDIDRLVQQGLSRRRELQEEVARLEARAEALLDGVHALGRQMIEALEAAATISSALPAPGALACASPPHRNAQLPEPALTATPPPSMAFDEEPMNGRAWVRPTLSVGVAVVGLSLLGWLSGLPTALARVAWLH
ncbi:MAG TPA: hypothetical protein VFA49_14790 [Chloroflexota bacterium]|nr:hypothetical protein [Chloroflexota bacterium]